MRADDSAMIKALQHEYVELLALRDGLGDRVVHGSRFIEVQIPGVVDGYARIPLHPFKALVEAQVETCRTLLRRYGAEP